ncbi:MAG TPA: alanine racemase [Puia sp.]|nr:alanine racemase [Puia sp.]
MHYTIGHIREIVQGKFLQQRRDDGVQYLLLDSRRLIFPETSLFFALVTSRRDGHVFLEDLYMRGVRNFVVSQDPRPASSLPDANIVLVKDSLAGLQQLAAYHRRQFSIPVIGITGSNGKTIVKEWLNQLLEDEYHIARSPRSYNSQTGVPLSVWQLGEAHELAIFEAGISRREEMNKLEPIIRPTIGLFTNIGAAHSEGFGSLDEKAREKAQLFRHAQVIIYCSDQPEPVRALAKLTPAPQLFSWGHDKNATLHIRSIHKKDGATTVTAWYPPLTGPDPAREASTGPLPPTTPAGEPLSFTIPFTDEASVQNAIHCICVLLYFGQTPGRINPKLQGLSPVAMRLELKGGINHCSIINDSYSADLSSLQIALDFLSQQQQHERRTVILSDILESGRDEGELYAEIAGALQQKRIDRLVGIGEKISAHAGVFARAFTGRSVFYPTVDSFKKDIRQLHFRDETILLKGARLFEFEQIDQLLSEQLHQTVLEINLNAMAHNLRQYRQLLQPGTRVMAMVKAFAYGSGSYEIANLLQFHRADYLGVAYADEGVVLRKAGIGMPIMVMNAEDSSFDALAEYNLEPVIYSPGLLRSLDRWLDRQGLSSFPVHIELETGMHRLGFPMDKIGELCVSLKTSSFTVLSVFSHLAASEEAQQDEFTRHQASQYMHAAAMIREALGYGFLRHISNSAAIIRHPFLQLDMVRLGIGLYGTDSAGSQQLELQEVSTLKSTIAQIQQLQQGDTVGYNRKGIAASGTIIATVRIGYADGYPRSLGNGAGKMWVRGHLAPVIGSVCMDMTMIDVTGIPDVQEGDEVVVFGNELSVSQLAQWGQTIPYEILTGVSQRVRRVYFEE